MGSAIILSELEFLLCHLLCALRLGMSLLYSAQFPDLLNEHNVSTCILGLGK